MLFLSSMGLIEVTLFSSQTYKHSYFSQFITPGLSKRILKEARHQQDKLGDKKEDPSTAKHVVFHPKFKGI